MTGFFRELFSNGIIICGLLSWLVAQVLKTIIYAAINGRLDWERLFGDGGMPSGHSATVTAVAISCGMQCGFDSPAFAISGIMAIVVMHDAMGVRLETGKQAKVLNELLAVVQSDKLSNQEKLKEFVGHTPFQVFMGFLLGLAISIIFNLLWR